MELNSVIIWWLIIEIIGFSVIPITSYICNNLKDKGYSLSKAFGLLLLTYIGWLLSYSKIGYSVFLSLFIIIGFSLYLLLKKGIPKLDIKYIIKLEILFTIAYLVFVAIRAYSPEIYWTGGEKFMDSTFINSFLRSNNIPPNDPWMSGEIVYYYYFGYLIVANIIKLSGIFPSIAFNLAIPLFFAISTSIAYGIGYNLTENSKAGLITAFFVTIAGNLVGLAQLYEILAKGGNLLSFNYWTASRVIPYTINEFPFFSFLQADVHPHAIAIGFQLMVLLFILNMLKSEINYSLIFVMALIIGFMYPLNTWDYPIYLFIAISIIGIKAYLSKENPKKTLFWVALMSILSYVLYLPYHIYYNIGRSVSFVSSNRTELIYYIAIFGVFIFLIYVFLLKDSKIINLKTILSFLVISGLAILLKFQLLIFIIPTLVLSLILLKKEHEKNNIYILLLIITATLLSLFCELFYVEDALGSGSPDYIRLNTVFKLYLQIWILFGISSGFIAFKYRNIFREKKAIGIFLVFLIFAAMIYPVFASIGKSGGFKKENPTLNGELYVKYRHPQEYKAILWFRNLSDSPVVLQAPGVLYKWNTYITAFTGLPTVIGWGGHELNWRFPSNKEVNTRWSDVRTIYTSQNSEKVYSLLEKYNISYIYFGEVEKKRYNTPKFFESHSDRFKVVFEYGDVVVYKFE